MGAGFRIPLVRGCRHSAPMAVLFFIAQDPGILTLFGQPSGPIPNPAGITGGPDCAVFSR